MLKACGWKILFNFKKEKGEFFQVDTASLSSDLQMETVKIFNYQINNL